ncbi:lysyl oxidase homolog 2B [Lepeophtheirus salmonis]|uniref:lysyl oxidase homolog 2B n=1 Tax=Lepeophtheirus salmonis TaxID=72036 RepID=UPI001AEB232D|nr:lysyl oxidase homolog 2B-like [Lepeophtheirus salmonis]
MNVWIIHALFLSKFVIQSQGATRMSLYDGFLTKKEDESFFHPPTEPQPFFIRTTESEPFFFSPTEPGLPPLQPETTNAYNTEKLASTQNTYPATFMEKIQPDLYEPLPTDPSVESNIFVPTLNIPATTDVSHILPITTTMYADEYEDYDNMDMDPLDVQTLISDLLKTGGSSGNDVKEGDLRLVDGRDKYEGNLQIFHDGRWGSVCDDEWDMSDAIVACKQLGFGKPKRYYHSSQFGYTKRLIHMDNLYCYGTEKRLQDCRFNGWGDHDCERTESAGLKCTSPPPPPTTPPPATTARPQIKRNFKIRLNGGRIKEEGRVEVSFEGSANFWAPVCGDGWDLPAALVACRELGLKYAQNAFQTHLFTKPSKSDSTNFTVNPGISGINCKGNEDRLSDCFHDEDIYCPRSGSTDVAGIVCVDEQADLAIDVYALISSTHLEDKTIFSLACAMEENCLASEAYSLRLNNPNYNLEVRRLLRFTTSIENIGNADFRPFIPKSHWEWHACHAHYHSMEVFAHFDVLNVFGARVAEGHKASFCLEDRECYGVEAKYSCENYGDQGITPGCKDIYYHNIDCQWLDMTEVDPGIYTFRMAINPEYKVAEQSFENNAVECVLTYTQQYALMSNCTIGRP